MSSSPPPPDSGSTVTGSGGGAAGGGFEVAGFDFGFVAVAFGLAVDFAARGFRALAAESRRGLRPPGLESGRLPKTLPGEVAASGSAWSGGLSLMFRIPSDFPELRRGTVDLNIAPTTLAAT